MLCDERGQLAEGIKQFGKGDSQSRAMTEFPPLGIGLKVSCPTARFGRHPCQDSHQGSQGCDQQQHVHARDAASASKRQSEAKAVAFDVPEAFLDFHAQPIQLDDLPRSMFFQRGGSEPWLAILLTAARATGRARVFAWPARSTPVLVYQAQRALVGPTRAQLCYPQTLRCGCGLGRTPPWQVVPLGHTEKP